MHLIELRECGQRRYQVADTARHGYVYRSRAGVGTPAFVPAGFPFLRPALEIAYRA